MKLTCVTAVFNAIKSGNRENLIRCVRSVAALKTEHEHLIYDGGSTDGTVELLRELESCGKMPHLRVVSEPDTGVYNALNKGVRDAQGEWFYVMGCDDFIVDQKNLEKCIAFGMRSCVDVVVSPVWISEDLHSVLSVQRNCILCATPYPHQGFLMRTKLLREMNGYDEDYSIAADYELILRLLWRRDGSSLRIIFNREPFTFYNTRGMSSNAEKCYEEFDRAIKSVLGVSKAEACDLRMKTPKSLSLILRCLTHRSREIRRAGRFLLVRYGIGRLGLLKPDGALRWH